MPPEFRRDSRSALLGTLQRIAICDYAYVGGNPISNIDPLGLWGQDAHTAIIEAMFPGLPWGMQQAIERGSEDVDDPLNQGPSTAFQHAMRAPGQSVADAQRKMCAFVNSNLAAYQSLSNSQDQYSAFVALGRALHPIMRLEGGGKMIFLAALAPMLLLDPITKGLDGPLAWVTFVVAEFAYVFFIVFVARVLWQKITSAKAS